MIGSILLSMLCGAIIGLERRSKGKAAGLKTLALIALGSTLFTMIGVAIPGGDRTIANIVSGIGFLGAGCVFLDRSNHVSGLTTAAVVWLVAALGIMCGLGLGMVALPISIGITIMLTLGARLENYLFPHSEGASLPLKDSAPEPGHENT